jgi:histidinol-phosphatase (PHP family)
MIDYHLHTSRCCHAAGIPQEYLATAEILDLREVGFADHFPLGLLDFTPRVQVTMLPAELNDYLEEIEKLKALSRKVRVKTGIEIDYLPGTEEKLDQLLKEYKFDYVIGSIHFLDEWDFTHPVYADTYKERDLDALYGTYFELVWSACRSGFFDIIGHIDVVKKFGYRPRGAIDHYMEETARVLAETGTSFELNTAGRDAPVGEFYPDRRLLEAALAHGVTITTGSDAHSPEQVGRYFYEAEKLLREVGYRELATFTNRTRSQIPL